LIDRAGAETYSADFFSSGNAKRITNDIYQMTTFSESYLVRVSMPKDELALAYLTVES
jgi:hypothetical protein